jgi:hypothetical protein
MKLRFVLILAAAVLLSAGFMPGQAVFTEFQGTGTGSSVYLTFGTFLCPGGEPAGPFPPNPPCSPGSRVDVRGMVYTFNITATDGRVTGKFTNVFNANTDGWTPAGSPGGPGPGSGQLWGTSRLEITDGGVWEGTWTGEREVTSVGAFSSVRAVMHGSGGSIQGLKSEWEISIPHKMPLTFTGRILVPGGKSR